MKKTPLIVVCGPTASGKTDFAINLAKELNTEIVSADSIQIYRGIEVLSAAPTKEEMKNIPHHLVGFKELNEEYSVGDFVKDATLKISEIYAKGKIPILCGGTGLYISSLIDGIDFSVESSDKSVRAKFEDVAKTEGGEKLYKMLLEKDSEAANWIHPNNTVRVIRALEIMEITGITFSEYRKNAAENESPYDAIVFFLNKRNREDLYRDIELRVDNMILSGMEKEARKAIEKNPSKTAFSAIGLKEFSLSNDIEEVIKNIKKGTRHYAKRQISWFSRIPDTVKLFSEDFSSKSEMVDAGLKIIKERFKID